MTLPVLPHREQMLEWIDALRGRLRELGVLTPKDNLYSREPESLRSPLLRNPASPLPPTPTAFQFPPHALEFRGGCAVLCCVVMCGLGWGVL